MKTFHLTVAKVGEQLFDGEVTRVILPGSDGVFEVLPEHEALVSELKAGVVKLTDAQMSTRTFDILGGLAEISHNQATVIL